MTLRRRAVLGAGLAAIGPARIIVRGRRLSVLGINAACAIGRSGIRRDKREGDGATPAGNFPLRRVFYRADRLQPPQTALPLTVLDPADAWSDDPADPAYNQPVRLPHAFHAEPMWRTDGLYDALAVIGTNDDPVQPGRGSAIFLHIARLDHGPTDGCIAVPRDILLRVLAQCGPGTTVDIGPA